MKTLVVLLISLFAGSLTASAQTIDFSPNHNLVFCGPTDVYFVCQSSQTLQNIWWDFGDGFSGIGLNAVHRYTKPGVYDVKMVVEYNGVKDSVIKPAFVEMRTKPNIGFSVEHHELDIPMTRIFTFTGENPDDQIVSYNWKVNETAVSLAPCFSFRFPTQGTYAVSLSIANASDCVSVLDTIVVITDQFPQPTAIAETGSGNYSCLLTADKKHLLIERNGSTTELLHIRLLDLSGRLLHEYTLAAYLNSLQVELPNAELGLCVVELSSKSYESVFRIPLPLVF